MSETDDLPAELANAPTRDYLGDSLARVFEHAQLVGFHPEKALIAAWYGGTGCNVFDPAGWFDFTKDDPFSAPNGESGEVYHFNLPDPSRVEEPKDNARETFERYGFLVVD